MKKFISGAKHRISPLFPRQYATYLILLLFSGFIFSSCKKEVSPGEVEPVMTESLLMNTETLNAYTGLAPQTFWELQQAKAASAKYKRVENAIRDGYVDIAVDVENMGHHYLKASAVDGNFDFREPEILVYNKDHSGTHQLVAVEYAVPLNAPRPEGFTGIADVWDGNVGFSLWLLHAWVWEYNPMGVFNPTNPNVHLH